MGKKMNLLKPIIGSEKSENVLIFLLAREEGNSTEIARFYNTEIFGIQTQMAKLEIGAVIVSKKIGRTRVYSFNPRYAFLKELKSLLQKALSFYPNELQEELLMNRRRPRRAGKPL
jgi:predicted transcriptional regulator